MAHVLVVDDDRPIRDLLQYALEFEGHSVTAFPDGRGVVAALASASQPTVVLLDLSMPHMTGWDVCAALAADPTALAGHQVVIMTAEALPSSEVPAPAVRLVRKPFDLDDVCALVVSLASFATVVAHAPSTSPLCSSSPQLA